MKRCPECRRDYTDETLNFCLDDGAQLLDGPASFDEPATAILSEPPAAGGPTRSVREDPSTKYVQPPAIPTCRDSDRLPEPRTFDRRLLFVPVVLVAAVASFFSYRYLASADNEKINSIAVLPFENRSGNADSEYLSDGLSDSLIYRLTQLANLKVSPTSSVIRYKGKQADAAEIAKELEVDAVMSGKLAQRGDDLTISVELVDARTRKLIWAEQYDRRMADLLAVQREIATTITEKLALKLSGNEPGIEKKYTSSNEAYQMYLKGRYFWNKRDEENLRKAIEQFKAAADRDPKFALAFVGISDSYVLLPYYSSAPQDEVLAQAKAYAERALAIDDSLGEAHTALGYVNRLLWNWAEAEKELKKGIELNPKYATAYKFYGNVLTDFGRTDEAIAAYKRAQELEPLSLIISANLTEVYLEKDDLNAAAEQCQRAIDLDQNWYTARQLRSLVYIQQGRLAEAVVEAEKSVDLSKRQGSALSVLGYAYTKAGNNSKAASVLEELFARYAKGQANGHEIARIYIGMGDKDQAFEWLNKDLQPRNATMPSWLGMPPFNSLHGDERFKDLVRQIGLPEFN